MKKEYEYCLRCGRKLKSDKSRLQGYGDICFEKMLVNQRNRLFTLSSQSSIIREDEEDNKNGRT